VNSPGAAFHTLRWLPEGALELLDQRALPRALVYLRLTSAAAVADAIGSLAVRGAPAIGCAAAYGVAVEAWRLRDTSPAAATAQLEYAIARLAASRPTAVNLFWALDRMRGAWQRANGASGAALAETLLAEADAIAREDQAVNRRMGELGAALVPDGARILTHCNAGALATAGHGTALGVVRSAHGAGKRPQVFADETRPVLQGARLTAWELQQDGIPVTLIPDVAAGHLLARGAIDLVIVGADRVAANGDVANKIGTYALAVLADRHRVPFYVACPLSTLDLATASGDAIPIEERAATEVLGYGTERWAPDGIDVLNPAFDVTPASLVTALITEAGVLHRPDAPGLRRLVEGALSS
jgi:methylthioribose-1-phosphate isomerase